MRRADDPEPLVAVGRWDGEVLEAPRGAGGFGYDPLLYMPAFGRTVAELDAAAQEPAQPPRARMRARMRRGCARSTGERERTLAWRASDGAVMPIVAAPTAPPLGDVAERLARCMRPGALTLAALPPLSLYVHLPWCLKKCPYCDFNSHDWRDERGALPEARYVDALRADLEASLPFVWGRRVHTVFIGGGTPSLFAPAAIERLRRRDPRPPAARARLRDHARGQSRHLRARALPRLPRRPA